MIKVIAKISVEEVSTDEFIKGAGELVAETRRESGCIAYELFRDVNYKNEFTFIEEWATPEALENHMKSRHFQEIMPKLAELREKDMEVSVCTQVM